MSRIEEPRGPEWSPGLSCFPESATSRGFAPGRRGSVGRRHRVSPVEVTERVSVTRRDRCNPDLRVHDRSTMAVVVEPEQVADLMERGPSLHLGREGAAAVIQEGEGDAR